VTQGCDFTAELRREKKRETQSDECESLHCVSLRKPQCTLR